MNATAVQAPLAGRPVLARPALRRFAWIVLLYNIAVVLWGAVVRATSSGAGCGAHWPLCNGIVLPVNPRLATVIEFTHRVMSGLSLLLVFALVGFVFAGTVRRHLARSYAVAALVLTLNEALLGALLVLLRHVAQDQSAARAVYLSLHLANTLLLLGALTLTAHFLSRTQAFVRGSVQYLRLPLALSGLAATVVVGISGSLAALGDTLFPMNTTSLSAGLAADFSSSSQWLIRLRIVHPASAILAGGFILWLLAETVFGQRGDGNRNLAWWLVGLLALQVGLGFLDVALRAPVWMQVVHLLGADALWAVLVVLTARVTVLPRATPASA